MNEYLIYGETLDGIAKQVKRISGVDGKLTPEQMITNLLNVTADSQSRPLQETFLTDAIANHIVSETDFAPGGILEDITPPATLSGAKCYYNGVLLPGIPVEMLERYPYAWIRNNTRTGYYDLLLSQEKWYLKDENTLAKSGTTTMWYQIAIATAGTAEAWTLNSVYSAEAWGNESDRRIMWANIDIPNGSATATEIYFEGSEPVLAE